MKQKLALTAVMTLALSSVAVAEKWDMPMAYSATNFHSEQGVIFADKVKEYTKGDLEITVHPGGSLFKGGEIKRAIQTANIALATLQWEHIDQLRSWHLNERHYGAWQGKNKDEVKKEYGEELFLAVRRGYATRPPLLDPNDPRVPWMEKKYQPFPHNSLPLGESLKDTKERVLPYFKTKIIPELQKGKSVLVCAHGNSLRALVMYLEDISKEEIPKLEIPTGEVRVYTFDDAMQIISREILQ